MRSIYELLLHASEKHPDATFVEHGDEQQTYRQVLRRSRAVSHALRSMGVQRGDRVVIFLDQSIDQICAMFGVSELGSVFVFANPDLAASQVQHIIEDSGARVFVSTPERMNKSSFSTSVATLDIADTRRGDNIDVVPTIGGLTRQDIACLIYTSGSTGRPKGVVVPSSTLLDGARIVSGYLGISDQDRILSVLPINFDYGLNQVLGALYRGATLVLHRFVFVKALLDTIESRDITGLPGMPPVWNKIFNGSFKLPEDLNLGSVRYLSNTGGKVPQQVVEQMRVAFPSADVFLMYGLTEAFRSSFLPPSEIDKRPGSIGKAIPEVELMVVGKDGKECPPGTPGQLVHRGALVTLGYWNAPDKTNEVFRQNPRLATEQGHLNERVVFSGDIVKADDDGYLYFVSRSDEMIKASGYRISPTELEEALCTMDSVSNAIVFGRDLGNGEQAVIAVLESENCNLQKKDVLQHCRSCLPAFMHPKEVHVETEIPRTANGKLDRPEIRKRYA